MSDRASVNNVTVHLTLLFSHTGENMKNPIFMSSWISMFSRSPRTIQLPGGGLFLAPSKIHLLEILNDLPNNRKLKIVTNASEPFVNAWASVYGEISTLRFTISNPF